MRIYVAGINGMVGSALALEAEAHGHQVLGKASSALDFTDRKATFTDLAHSKPDVLFMAAAKVGGIGANSSLPVDFLSINLQVQTNLLDAAHAAKIEKVIFLGSSCIYPKFAPQPISESALLTGELEPSNEPYALAKIAGVKLVEAYNRQFGHKWISVMPTNLYGPRDNFNLETAHVLPALIHRIHNAMMTNESDVVIWGDGTPLREFLHVQDLASACMLLMDRYEKSDPINIGSGQEISVHNLAMLISEVIGYTGVISFNPQRPNGTPRKLLDSGQMNSFGWAPQISLFDGILSTYDWFLKHRTREVQK
jgi:GDP-L-fucose synthase